MSTELVEKGRFLSAERIKLIREMYCKKASPMELQHFLEVCESRQLDPVLKQIYAVFRWSKKENRDVMSIQVGIDGFRSLADRTGCYAGSDKAVFEYEADGPHPSSATVTVYKMVHGVRCPFTAEAAWEEYFPDQEAMQFFWRKMPRGQLAKVAEALALRKAFPHQLSGMYEPAEMHQAGFHSQEVQSVQGEVVNALPSPKESKPAPVPSTPRTEELQKQLEAIRKDQEGVPQAPPLRTGFEPPESSGDYVVIVGKKHRGKKLKDIPVEELTSFMDWLETKAEKPLSANAQEFLERAEAYLADRAVQEGTDAQEPTEFNPPF